MRLPFRQTTRYFSAVVPLVLGALSCEQYEYDSPQPGIIEVRLAATNNRQDLIPFADADSNSLYMNIREVTAVRPGGIELPIFADLNAIRRNSDGDPVNCLNSKARDSLLLLGKAYAPPGTFTGLTLIIEPPPFLFISQGFYGSLIPIVQILPSQTFQEFPRKGEDLSIVIEEGRVTRVNVTFNMDSSLVQRSESFDYIPHFYVSSVINY